MRLRPIRRLGWNYPLYKRYCAPRVKFAAVKNRTMRRGTAARTHAACINVAVRCEKRVHSHSSHITVITVVFITTPSPALSCSIYYSSIIKPDGTFMWTNVTLHFTYKGYFNLFFPHFTCIWSVNFTFCFFLSFAFFPDKPPCGSSVLITATSVWVMLWSFVICGLLITLQMSCN